MFIDSHCHLDFPELSSRLPEIIATMTANDVGLALCVAVDLPDFPRILDLINTYPQFYGSVGVHPDYVETPEPTVDQLIQLSFDY